jgi:hypothetical protein
MGKAEDKAAADKDLRKEVEMTEHHATIEEICRQYDTDSDKGLTDAEVLKVK